jgi:hypothetical protein
MHKYALIVYVAIISKEPIMNKKYQIIIHFNPFMTPETFQQECARTHSISRIKQLSHFDGKKFLTPLPTVKYNGVTFINITKMVVDALKDDADISFQIDDYFKVSA